MQSAAADKFRRFLQVLLFQELSSRLQDFLLLFSESPGIFGKHQGNEFVAFAERKPASQKHLVLSLGISRSGRNQQVLAFCVRAEGRCIRESRVRQKIATIIRSEERRVG